METVGCAAATRARARCSLGAQQLGFDVSAAQRERESRRRRVFHFDPHLKRMTTLDGEPGGDLWYHAKGAPLELLERCTAIRGHRRRPPPHRTLTERRSAPPSSATPRQGLRVLGFAERHVARVEEGERELVESHLTFSGWRRWPTRRGLRWPTLWRAVAGPGSASS